MQSVSSRIWTRVAVFISYDDNDYTTGTSKNSPEDDHPTWLKALNIRKLEQFGLVGF